jgi:ribosome biogenesis protein YTM1
LKKFVGERNLSKEDILVVEYMPALSMSGESQNIDCPAWIGSLVSSKSPFTCITGCYDGNIRFFDTKQLTLQETIVAHEQPVRAVAHCIFNNQSIVFSSSKDQSVKCWSYNINKNNSITCNPIAHLYGAMNSVECIDIHKDSPNIVLCGDWNGSVLGYDMSATYDSAFNVNSDRNEDPTSGKKKKKSNTGKSMDTNIQVISSPKFTFNSHVQSVSSIQYANDSNHIYTSSYDHSLKYWDVETMDCVTTHAGSKVITSMDFNKDNLIIATSHPDGKTRLWDSRQQDNTSTKGLYSASSSECWLSEVGLISNRKLLIAVMY